MLGNEGVNKNFNFLQMKRGLDDELIAIFAKANVQDAGRLKRLANELCGQKRVECDRKIRRAAHEIFTKDAAFFSSCRIQALRNGKLCIRFLGEGLMLLFNQNECVIKTHTDKNTLLAHTQFVPQFGSPFECENDDSQNDEIDQTIIEEHERVVLFVRNNLRSFVKLRAKIYEIQHPNDINQVRHSIVTLLCVRKFATSWLNGFPVDAVRLIAKKCWAMRCEWNKSF